MFSSDRLIRGLAIGVLALVPLSAALAVPGKAESLDFDALGQQISTAFNERNSDLLVNMVDMQVLGTRVGATLYEKMRKGAPNSRAGSRRPPRARTSSASSSRSSTTQKAARRSS